MSRSKTTSQSGAKVSEVGKQFTATGVLCLLAVVLFNLLVFAGATFCVMSLHEIMLAIPVILGVIFLCGIGGVIYLYRKLKRQVNEFAEKIELLENANDDYELNVMGGLLSVRVEHDPKKLLEVNSQPAKPVLGIGS